jgi:SET domain-containing protein
MKLSELKNLDKNTKKMISDFFGMNENKEFLIPEGGLNGMDISFFLNTSLNPNIKTIDDGTNFISIKKIKKGEELTVSYAPYDVRYKK